MNKNDFLQAKGFIYADIEREINLAKLGKDAGNFLSALGLLCYTEFMGGVKRNKFQRGEAAYNFNTFFDYIGNDYANFRKNCDVYSIFRCGLAHEYYVKKHCQIAMFGNVKMGVGESNESYYFVVNKYFEDFKFAVDKLEKEVYS